MYAKGKSKFVELVQKCHEMRNKRKIMIIHIESNHSISTG